MGVPLSSSTPLMSLPVLVTTADAALREVFADLLAEGGYTTRVASSLADARSLIEERTYAMILAEVFTGASTHAWDDAYALLRRARPVPVGLLVTHSQVPDAALRAGFAFVQRMPFEIDELLARIASVTARPLTPQQMRWVDIVQRYHSALAAADWDALLDLCSDDVVCYPPTGSRITSERKLQGKAAVRAYFESAVRQYQRLSRADLAIFPQPRSVTARYMLTWTSPDERIFQMAVTVRLRFSGDRIRQIGLRISRTGAIAMRAAVRAYPA